MDNSTKTGNSLSLSGLQFFSLILSELSIGS